MKKFLVLLVLLVLLLPVMAGARSVSGSRARAVAESFMKSRGLSGELSLLNEAPAITKSSASSDDFWIFSRRGGGFVIISGDDGALPVIGWSDKGSFNTEGMPENLTAWMDMWHGIVCALRNGELEADSAAASEWNAYLEGRTLDKAGGSKLLTTANWNQSFPFNMYCPSFDGAQCVTGCVATATGIVMKYHRWPEAGTGTVPGYSFTDDGGTRRNVQGITLGYNYNWDIMSDNLDSNSPLENQQAVARLLADIGIMVQAFYNPGGTGAYTNDVYPALVEHMGYDGSAMHKFRCYFSASEWADMLRENIDNIGPVLYSASGEEGGHAFVLDGYNEQNQFHINWGWGGAGNGYYTVPAFETFVENHAATFSLMPDRGGRLAEDLVIDTYKDSKGFTVDTTEITTGVPFKMTCEYIYNMSSRVFKGIIGMVITGRDGNVREVVAESDTVRFQAFGGYSFYLDDAVIESEILVGDYLRLAYKSENTPEWALVRGNVEDKVSDRIQIGDSQTIEECTSFRYTSGEGALVISSKPGISWKLTSSTGVELTEGITFEDGVLTISTASFPLDTYTLTLTKRSESKTVKFKFGAK